MSIKMIQTVSQDTDLLFEISEYVTDWDVDVPIIIEASETRLATVVNVTDVLDVLGTLISVG